jgi:hypothetical protein
MMMMTPHRCSLRENDAIEKHNICRCVFITPPDHKLFAPIHACRNPPIEQKKMDGKMAAVY